MPSPARTAILKCSAKALSLPNSAHLGYHGQLQDLLLGGLGKLLFFVLAAFFGIELDRDRKDCD